LKDSFPGDDKSFEAFLRSDLWIELREAAILSV